MRNSSRKLLPGKSIGLLIRLVALVLMVGLLSGCGGAKPASDGAENGSPNNQGGQAKPAASQAKPEVPRPFTSDNDTPGFFTEALKKKEPILITFYDDDRVSEELTSEIEEVMSEYAGQAVFFVLRLGDTQEITLLAGQFSPGFVPYTAVVDRSGTIIFEASGYVDSGVLRQALFDAVNK